MVSGSWIEGFCVRGFWGSGFRFRGSGFSGFWVSGWCVRFGVFEVLVSGLVCQIQGFMGCAFRVWCVRFGVGGSGFGVSGFLSFGVSCSVFRGWGFAVGGF